MVEPWKPVQRVAHVDNARQVLSRVAHQGWRLWGGEGGDRPPNENGAGAKVSFRPPNKLEKYQNMKISPPQRSVEHIFEKARNDINE